MTNTEHEANIIYNLNETGKFVVKNYNTQGISQYVGNTPAVYYYISTLLSQLGYKTLN